MVVAAEVPQRDAEESQPAGRRVGLSHGEEPIGLGVKKPVAESFDLSRRVGGPARAPVLEYLVEPDPVVLGGSGPTRRP